jgi:hypothetical protein
MSCPLSNVHRVITSDYSRLWHSVSLSQAVPRDHRHVSRLAYHKAAQGGARRGISKRRSGNVPHSLGLTADGDSDGTGGFRQSASTTINYRQAPSTIVIYDRSPMQPIWPSSSRPLSERPERSERTMWSVAVFSGPRTPSSLIHGVHCPNYAASLTCRSFYDQGPARHLDGTKVTHYDSAFRIKALLKMRGHCGSWSTKGLLTPEDDSEISDKQLCGKTKMNCQGRSL